ncbi:hypothetical protein HU200_034607 [Digitaria exilis]|uniref:Uncharacterized protein n=1 Tax=Digitaria exilis TaxID=1010633 RepID=A0A835BJD8_9POAL|nr:hypothetical protein HU200_034607 [Digitaria exilis]
MADLVLGLAKTTVEGTITMVRSAMEEEAKLKKSVQRDLLVISDEFEMMNSFLNDAKDHVTDNVTRTQVRQVGSMALDVEDCIEIILHLDNKPHWWRRMMLPSCFMPALTPGKDLDAAVANIEQLKARVEAMGLRNLRYNRIGDRGHMQAVANAMAPHIFVTENRAQKKQSRQMDLVTLINKKDPEEAGRKEEGTEKGQTSSSQDNDEIEEVENHSNVQQKVNDDQLQVISVLGTGSDLEMAYIETCKSFEHRAWVKLVHPFNPIEFIRSVLAQFHKRKNMKKQFCCQPVATAGGEKLLCAKQEEPLDFLEVLLATNNELIADFQCQIKLKYLVVLEDVSTMVDWEAVRGYLPDKKNGSCIVVHTRRFEVARSCVGYGCQVSEVEKNPSVYLLDKEV